MKIFEITIPENSSKTLTISYSGNPKNMSIDKDFSAGINEDYVDLNRRSVAPRLYSDYKGTGVKGTVKIDSEFTVITQGEKNNKLSEDNGLATWSFSCDSFDDFSLEAGKYQIFERDVDVTTVEFFYPVLATEELRQRGTDVLDIFSHYSKNFAPLNKSTFKLVITSGVKGGGGSASGNISYVSEDCLAKKANTDSIQASEADTFAVLAHEIAHEWWGVGINVTNENSNAELDKKHDKWSAGSFAEFSTYLFLKDKFSEDYAKELLLTKWQDGSKELKQNFYYRNPEYINKLSGISKYYVTMFLKGNKMYALGPMDLYNIYNYIGEDNYLSDMKTIYRDYYNKDDKKLTFSDFLNITNVSEEVAING